MKLNLKDLAAIIVLALSLGLAMEVAWLDGTQKDLSKDFWTYIALLIPIDMYASSYLFNRKNKGD